MEDDDEEGVEEEEEDGVENDNKEECEQDKDDNEEGGEEEEDDGVEDDKLCYYFATFLLLKTYSLNEALHVRIYSI